MSNTTNATSVSPPLPVASSATNSSNFAQSAVTPNDTLENVLVQDQQQIAKYPFLSQFAGQHERIMELADLFKKSESSLHRNLTVEEEAFMTANRDYFKIHAGHENSHLTMIMVLFGLLIGSQIAIGIWKKVHRKSYNVLTLAGLWLIPAVYAWRAKHVRFLWVWALFSAVNGLIVKKAFAFPLDSKTPRLVYLFYSRAYNVSYVIGVLGYIFTLIAIFTNNGRATEGSSVIWFFDTGFILLFYGIYFGALSRDFVERIADRMAMAVGYYARSDIPTRHLRSGMCAICGGDTVKSGEKDPIFKANCGHVFHMDCIRGWTIVGKKDCCPYCKEKVDLRSLRSHPWDITQQFYLNLLDLLKMILVWNPVVFLITHYVFWLFRLK